MLPQQHGRIDEILTLRVIKLKQLYADVLEAVSSDKSPPEA
jgi:hypothetical protein